MKLSNKQQKELRIIKWFIPEIYKDIEITEDDIKKFFDYSDKGIGKQEIISHTVDWGRKDGLNALFWGKQRRDLQISYYLDDWGDILNAWSFLDEPEYIVDWIAKKLNKPAIKEAWIENKGFTKS